MIMLWFVGANLGPDPQPFLSEALSYSLWNVANSRESYLEHNLSRQHPGTILVHLQVNPFHTVSVNKGFILPS